MRKLISTSKKKSTGREWIVKHSHKNPRLRGKSHHRHKQWRYRHKLVAQGSNLTECVANVNLPLVSSHSHNFCGLFVTAGQYECIATSIVGNSSSRISIVIVGELFYSFVCHKKSRSLVECFWWLLLNVSVRSLMSFWSWQRPTFMFFFPDTVKMRSLKLCMIITYTELCTCSDQFCLSSPVLNSARESAILIR